MVKFEHDGETIIGRVKAATIHWSIRTHDTITNCLVESPQGMFEVTSLGDISDGEWFPTYVKKA